MKAFAVYNPTTGEILRAGICGDDDVSAQAGVDEDVLDTYLVADPYTEYIAGGEVTSKGTPPSIYHTWDWEDLSWHEDLAAAKAGRKLEVEQERETRIAAPIEYSGITFDGDALSQRNVSNWQTQIANGMSLPVGFVWRDIDNVDHAADAAFVNGLGAAMTERGTALYIASWAHKAAIDALTTVADIIAYDITTGW